jgi:hypothetical protein
MAAPPEVIDLVERFERNLEAYRSGQYKEAQLRQEFLDPFFKLLGWDVDNTQGFAEAYKDVIHEDSIRMGGGGTEAPDYCFRIGGTRKFFVEAKKPSVYVKMEIPPAFQLRRYAWSAKLPLSILTDFEEFAVYDTRIRPDKSDKASTARLFYCTFREYAEKWDWIADIFGRESILKGSFDKFAHAAKGKRGTAEVDKAFLAEIEGWRDMLARHIAANNPNLSQRDLNFAVQRTIDRIIFLRICEDRGIEPYGELQKLLEGGNVFERLCRLFYQADDRYNSGIFHFNPEKGRAEPPDDLTHSLKIEDKPVRDVVRSLYYPDSPYEFSVITADILGQIYEQFLGKVIRLTQGHRAKVEEKPEVKKAGGVYYTPTYIVDYIVQNTVGPLLEGKTPKEVSDLKILDPACGSGSFLIGAYQYLLDWHRSWYVSDGPEKWAKGRNPVLYQGNGRGLEWRLTTGEKRRILLSNIFGVDIDSQAVEVTKLSLLLKVLEGENAETLAKQLTLYRERALPDLGLNIKCGNSLIGPDFYAGKQISMFDEEEQYRINAFDWKREFPKIMKGGGFDAVIGNPPYGALITPTEAVHLQSKFTATNRDLDSYSLFMQLAVGLCRDSGRISMIVPTGWYSGAKYSTLRRFISTRTDPKVFINLPYDVFAAWVDTTVFVAEKRAEPLKWPRTKRCRVTLKTFPKRHKIERAKEFETGAGQADLAKWFAGGGDEYLTYADEETTSLVKKLRDQGRPFCEFADIQRGVTPFELTNTPRTRASRPAFAGTVRRYSLDRGPVAFIRFDGTLAEPKPERYFQGPRLLLRELISRQFRLQATKATEGFVSNKSMQSILAGGSGLNLNYLLGILNSHLISWYFLRISNIAQRDDFPKIVLKETRSLPIRPIDFSDKKGKARHDRIVNLVERMLDLQKKLPEAKTDHSKTLIQRQIEATDHEIDTLVYELYGLNEEEIKMVEGGEA